MLDSIALPPQTSQTTNGAHCAAFLHRPRHAPTAHVFTPCPAALVAYKAPTAQETKAIMRVVEDKGNSSAAVSRRLGSKWPKPVWHQPWKL